MLFFNEKIPQIITDFIKVRGIRPFSSFGIPKENMWEILFRLLGAA